MPVPWRIPHSLALLEFKIVYYAARDCGVGMGENQHWFWIWIGRLLFFKLSIMVPIYLTGLMLILALIQRRRRIPPEGGDWNLWLFIVMPLASLIYWFLSAPDPRFVGACFWLVAAGTSAFILSRFGASQKKKIFLAVGGLMLISAYYANHSPLLIPPGPDHGFYPPPVAVMKTFTTDSGLVLSIPAVGGLSWDAPLPCTPFPKKGLRLRKPGQMKSGFVLDEKGGG
jgi:hypothetical protein